MKSKEEEYDYSKAPWGSLGRTFTIGFVAMMGKMILNIFNKTTCINCSLLYKNIMERPIGTGLITVSNHTSSTLDDPMLFGALLPLSYLITENKHKGVRWVFCAEDICFFNKIATQFCLSGKVLPIKRGGGLQQESMRVVSRYVSEGNWAHIFPEGQISYTGKLLPLKWGIGKIICDSIKKNKKIPRVMAIYHSGMSEVMPKKSRIPRMGKSVEVIASDIIDLDDLVCRCNLKENPEKVWMEITNKIREELIKLEKKAKNNIDQENVNKNENL